MLLLPLLHAPPVLACACLCPPTSSSPRAIARRCSICCTSISSRTVSAWRLRPGRQAGRVRSANHVCSSSNRHACMLAGLTHHVQCVGGLCTLQRMRAHGLDPGFATRGIRPRACFHHPLHVHACMCAWGGRPGAAPCIIAQVPMRGVLPRARDGGGTVPHHQSPPPHLASDTGVAPPPRPALIQGDDVAGGVAGAGAGAGEELLPAAAAVLGRKWGEGRPGWLLLLLLLLCGRPGRRGACSCSGVLGDGAADSACGTCTWLT